MSNHCFKVRGLILAAALSGLGFISSAFAQTVIMNPDGKVTYVKTNLGGDRSRVNEINDAGQVVGWSQTAAGNRHAFITGPNGVGIKDLGTLGGSSSEALDINELGQVVGMSETTSGNIHAFITGPNGLGMRDLGTLGGSWSEAYGINESGQVAGRAGTPTGEQNAFITGPDGVDMKGLGTFGGRSSGASGINDTGQMVGTYSGTAPSYPGFYAHAFITGPNGVGVTDLGTGSYDYSNGKGINSAGQAIGNLGYWGLGGGFHTAGFITGPDGEGMTQFKLPQDGGWVGSIANDVNDAGQVVGYINVDGNYDHRDDPRHAFITRPNDEEVIDLNSYAQLPDGTYLSEAHAVNNLGQVVAYLAPIPEPQTYALMLAGLMLVGFMARRKKPEGRV